MTGSIDSYKTWKWKSFHNRRIFITSFFLLYCGFTWMYDAETIDIVRKESIANPIVKFYADSKSLFAILAGVYFVLFAVHNALAYFKLYDRGLCAQKSDYLGTVVYYVDYIFLFFSLLSIIISSTLSFFVNISFEKVSFTLIEIHLSRMSNVLQIFGVLFSINHSGCNDMCVWVIFMYYAILWCTCMGEVFKLVLSLVIILLILTFLTLMLYNSENYKKYKLYVSAAQEWNLHKSVGSSSHAQSQSQHFASLAKGSLLGTKYAEMDHIQLVDVVHVLQLIEGDLVQLHEYINGAMRHNYKDQNSLDSSLLSNKNRKNTMWALASLEYYIKLCKSIRLVVQSNVTGINGNSIHQDAMDEAAIDVADAIPGDLFVPDGQRPKTVLFSKVCLHVFSAVEAYYGNSLPLFVKDNDRFDVSITMREASVLELVMFLMVLGAISEDVMDNSGASSAWEPSVLTSSSTKASGVLYRSEESHRDGSEVGVNHSELRATYFFRCERWSRDAAKGKKSNHFQQGKNTARMKAAKVAGNIKLDTDSEDHWCIKLFKTAHAIRNRAQPLSIKVSPRHLNPGPNTSQHSNFAGVNQTNSGHRGADVDPSSHKEGSVGRRNSASATSIAGSASTNQSISLRMAGLLAQKYLPAACGKFQQQVVDSKFDAPSGNDTVVRTSWSLPITATAESGVRISEVSEVDFVKSRNFNGNEAEAFTASNFDKPIYKQCWLFIDSHLGNPLSLYALKQNLEALGVPLVSCPMYDLRSHHYSYPVAVVYEELLYKFKDQIKEDTRLIASSLVVLCEHQPMSSKTMLEYSDMRIVGSLPVQASLLEISAMVHSAIVITEPRVYFFGVSELLNESTAAVPMPGEDFNMSSALTTCSGGVPGYGDGKEDAAPAFQNSVTIEKGSDELQNEGALLTAVNKKRNFLLKMRNKKQLEDIQSHWCESIESLRHLLSTSKDYDDKPSVYALLKECGSHMRDLEPTGRDVLRMNVLEARLLRNAKDRAVDGIEVYDILDSPQAKKSKYIMDVYISALNSIKAVCAGNVGDLTKLGVQCLQLGMIFSCDELRQLSAWITLVQQLSRVIIIHSLWVGTDARPMDDNCSVSKEPSRPRGVFRIRRYYYSVKKRHGRKNGKKGLIPIVPMHSVQEHEHEHGSNDGNEDCTGADHTVSIERDEEDLYDHLDISKIMKYLFEHVGNLDDGWEDAIDVPIDKVYIQLISSMLIDIETVLWDMLLNKEIS